MLSFGTELFLAFWIASNNVGLPAGSPPPVRAATSTFFIRFAKHLPRLAAPTALLGLLYRIEQCRVACRVPAAGAGGDLDVLDQLGEQLAALGVDHRFLVL